MSEAQSILRPPALQPGDLVAVVAPAGPFDSALLEKGAAIWRDRGFVVQISPELKQRREYLAGDDDHRLKLLEAALSDPAVKAVVAARGGYGSLRLLDRLNLESLARQPKIVIGFSDLTALQLDLWRQRRLVTFSGPMMASRQLIEMNAPEREVYFATLRNTDPPPPLAAKQIIRPTAKTANGWMMAGNLTMLCCLAAAQRLPDLHGAVLLIEDVNEAPYRVDRALTALRLGGHLENLAGLVCGSFGPEIDDATLHRILLDCLRDSAFPILSGAEYGHDGPNRLIPLGVPVEFDSFSRQVRFLTAGVC